MRSPAHDFSAAGPPTVRGGSVATIDQSGYSTTSTVVQAAVSIGALTLLGDVISAVPTLQAGINHNRALLNSVIDVLQTKGILS